MIVVVIIAILATVALPSYRSYVAETIRAEGMGELLRVMDLQERYYTNQFPPTYTSTMTDLGFSIDDKVLTENGHYAISSFGGSCVYLLARAQGGEDDDVHLDLDCNGTKRHRLEGASAWVDGWP